MCAAPTHTTTNRVFLLTTMRLSLPSPPLARPSLSVQSVRHTSQPPRPSHVAFAAPSSSDDSTDADAIAAARARLTSAAAGPRPLTGPELVAAIRAKWGGRSYEARIVTRAGKVYCQIFWRFLEQASFNMSAAEYELQMDAVASVVMEMGVADVVRAGIESAPRPPGMTQGGGARAVSIPLDVATGTGGRSAEWNV